MLRLEKLIYILLTIILIIKCSDNPLNNDSKYRFSKEELSKNNKKKIYSLRKGQSIECDELVPLKMHIDLYNFNRTFPNSIGVHNKDIIVEAIYKAENILVEQFKICLGSAEGIYFTNEFFTSRDANIIHWDKDKLQGGTTETSTQYSLTLNNFFVFFNFSSSFFFKK